MKRIDRMAMSFVILMLCAQMVFGNIFAWLGVAFGLFDRMDRGVRNWYYAGLIMDVSVKPGVDYRTEYRNRYGVDFPSDREFHLGETNLSQYFEGGLTEAEDGQKYRSLDGSIAYCVGEQDWTTFGNFNFIGKNVNGVKIQIWLSPETTGSSLLLFEKEYKDTIGGRLQLFPIPEGQFATEEAKAEYRKLVSRMPFGKELIETIKVVPNGKGVEGCKGLQLRFIAGTEMASRFCDPSLDVATGYFQGNRITEQRQNEGVDCQIETSEPEVSIEVWDRFGYIEMPEKVSTGYKFKAIPIQTYKKGSSLKGQFVQVFYGKSQTTELSLDPPSPVDCITKRQTGMVEIETGKNNIIKIVPLSQLNSQTTSNTTKFQKGIIKISGSARGVMSFSTTPAHPPLSGSFVFSGKYLWDEVQFTVDTPLVEKMIAVFCGYTKSMLASCPQTGFIFDWNVTAIQYRHLDVAPLIPRAYRLGDKEYALETIQDVQDFANGQGRFSTIGGKKNFLAYCRSIGIIPSVAERLWQDFSAGNVGYVVAGPGTTYKDPTTGQDTPIIHKIKGVNWREASGVYGDMRWRDVSCWPQTYKIWVSKNEISITLGILAPCGNFTGVPVLPPTTPPPPIKVTFPGLCYPPPRPKTPDTWGLLYLGGKVESSHNVVVATATTFVPGVEERPSQTVITVFGSEASASAAASGGAGASVGDINNTANGGTAVATGGSTGPIDNTNINQNQIIVPKSAGQSIR